MIDKIELKETNTYQKVEVNNLTKVNFFFGSNGSGKSTIAKLLYNKSLSDIEKDNKFEKCKVSGFNFKNDEILVFDEKYVERNFISNTELSGLFTLNEENKDIDDQIRIRQKELEKLDIYLENFSKREKKIKKILNDKHEELKNNCWWERNSFDTFYEIELEYSRNKENHLRNIRNYLPIDKSNEELSLESLYSRYKDLFEIKREKIDIKISSDLFKKLGILENDIIPLLEEVITTNKEVNIAELIDALDIRKWVEEGRHFVLDDKKNICPFCQSETYDDNLKQSFEKYFNKTYQEKINKIKSLKEAYFLTFNQLLQNIIHVSKVYNKDNQTTNLHTECSNLLADNIKKLDRKLEYSNEIIEFFDIYNFDLELDIINNEIEDNNEKIEDFQKNKEQLTEDIWNYLAKESVNEIKEYDNYNSRITKILLQLNNLSSHFENSKKTIKYEVEKLKSKTVSTDKAVKAINGILKSSGFDNFEIEEKETSNNISRYILKRENNSEQDVFKTLSEGEKNFIAFLYFYQLVLGTDDKDSELKKKIVVIDDPVSSLDSQVLFVVSTLIHSLIEYSETDKNQFKNSTIKQVFILSHNLYFYKEVSFKQRPICRKKAHFSVSKFNGISNIEHKGVDTFVHNDYMLLWKSIKELKETNNKVFNITIGNSMRRIIESYVNFIGLGKSPWDSLKSLDVSDPIYPICSSLISEINDVSHKSLPFDDLYYQRIVNEEPDKLYCAFQKIFESIGEEHYKMMMN
ncbi:AAA family ATPase [Tenacibaculum finnmarkense]|uniref:AAA family ATPase n=1 Tax=Tenacibaculum finnmarkense TaxID=2781243 RepID=UPI001E3B17B2|nr:AAA family ATPase [Tenacibaculum finnmarkense]MCD8413532.1 AAA family ATPase [Tenacibaculum finnmarkense genomovar ulcerans]MCG8208395.1 AAA family ATPase [Tenacibaculum finnmarkense genomovar finnmarkense]MCG8724349.1 AAA family ATPase [Tenacibaculum finnmarkense]MCG8742659.1 AAA family ATPase [Tenacibaculum finnmarkense]MCG8766071.1 AAA family ATPase [Tenacibaculum finnmarkense]